MPFIDLRKKWVLAGLGLGLGVLLILGIRAGLQPPSPPPVPGMPADSLAGIAPSTRPSLEPPFFPPGSPGLQVAELIARQNYQEARHLLERVKRKGLSAPERGGLDFQRALCERELGNPKEAVARLRRLRDAHPALEDYRQLWLARALGEMGDPKGAIAAYEEFLPLCRHPALLEAARLELAELYAKRGNPQRALELAAQVQGDQAPQALFQLARLCEPDSATARSHRLRLLQEYPDHPLALEMARQLPALPSAEEAYARGLVYFRHELHAQAIQALEAFLGTYPRHPLAREARYLLGRALSGDRQWDKAHRTLVLVYEKYHYPAALYQLGVALGRLDRDQEALHLYRQFTRRYPKDELAPEALWQAARIAERDDQWALAGRLYGQLAREYPASPYRDEAQWRSGFMAYCRRHYEEALAIFSALGRQAADPQLLDQSLFWAGKAAGRLDRREEAKDYFQEAANGFPRSYYSTRAFSLGYRPNPAAVPPPDTTATTGEILPLRRAAALLQLGLIELAQAELPASGPLSPAELAALKAIRDRCEGLGFRDRALRLSARIASQDYCPEELRHAYPPYYLDKVVEAAREAQVDPYLVLSVIRQESFFDEGAVSPVGAIGLMQIMPQTGLVLARQMGLAHFERDLLFDPALSIRMGSRYLGEQVRAFLAGPAPHLSSELGLAAYNAGPQAARRWLERFAPEDPDAFVERIPYKETRLYVKKVLRNWAIYKTLSQA